MNPITKLYNGKNRYNFRSGWRWGIRISSALIVIAILALLLRGLNLGIDFEGGVSWEVQSSKVTIEQTREAMGQFGLADAKIQTLGADIVRVQGPAETIERQNEVRAVLARLGDVAPSSVAVTTVGPTWGGEVTNSALRALFFFVLAIMAYVTLSFAGEWKMAIGVIIAVFHDIIISVGAYALFQWEVTPATVIAFLTILGYSIYDTMVVYDKMLDNTSKVGMANRMTYADMASLSMNQVLLRSVNTIVVAVLPVFSTLVVGSFIFGARTLEEFAIALTVGMIIGAYSSIYVAVPAVVAMKGRETRYKQLAERLEGAVRTDSPAPVGARSSSGSPDPAGVGASRSAAPTKAPAGGEYGRTVPPRPRKKGKR